MSRAAWYPYVVACAAVLSACTSQLAERNPGFPIASGESWIAPQAASQNLLYVSGNSGYVYIFSFPKGKLVGTLTGFQEVAGLCADAAGNVWVANSAGFNVVEFAHAGTSPIATLPDYENYPFSCSVNRRNGDLAVSNIFSIQQGQGGSIAVYARARGTLRRYSDVNVAEYYFLTYGSDGKIYFDGTGGATNFLMARLDRGRFNPIVVKGATISSPGGVQYVGNSLAIGGGDRAGDAIVYRITNRGVVSGETTLAGAYSCISFTIWKAYIMCASSNGDVPIYAYPAGGEPITTIGSATSPFQVVMSEAQTR